MICAIKDKDISNICKNLSNTLEDVTIKNNPVISGIKEKVKKKPVITAVPVKEKLSGKNLKIIIPIVALVIVAVIIAIALASCGNNEDNIVVTDTNGVPVTDVNGEVITVSPEDVTVQIELDLDKEHYEDAVLEDNPDSITALVNKHRYLDEKYEPSDLVDMEDDYSNNYYGVNEAIQHSLLYEVTRTHATGNPPRHTQNAKPRAVESEKLLGVCQQSASAFNGKHSRWSAKVLCGGKLSYGAYSL